MKTFFQRYATPLITGLFIVSLISGIALFFHVGQSWFHGMHEWLSMMLILPFVLHIWKNWRAFVNYFRRPPMLIGLALSLAAAIAFIIPATQSTGGRKNGPPQFAFASAVLKNPLNSVAPLIGSTPDDLVKKLQDAGFTAAKADVTLSDIASQSGKNEGQLLQVLTPRRSQ